mmetsp:Transcript_15412/g.20076  ORF Transcript_15412/g.20076 Transcript_15412/m.20076 type:complete len:182 (-) Transcript_15412:139-684(-)
MKTIIFINCAAFLSVASAFAPNAAFLSESGVVGFTSLKMAKGFGKEEKKVERVKSEGQIDRETKANKYDEISESGGQEYNIFVRQFGSEDTNWMPCGAIAVPRGAQVSNAIFANEDGLKSAIIRLYPKLKGMEQEFEFGYNLKVYPDDPVEVAMKRDINSGPSVGNWISNLLSPVDTSKIN